MLNVPQIGTRGHVHYVELDQFLGTNYLVNVRGPINPVVDPAVARLDTDLILHGLQAGVVRPDTPFDLSAAIVTAVARRETDMIANLAQECGQLEQN